MRLARRPNKKADSKVDAVEAQKIAQQLYLQNYELNEQNKTLELLHAIDGVVLASSGLNKVAGDIAKAISETADFPFVAIFVEDKRRSHMRLIGMHVDPAAGEIGRTLLTVMSGLSVPCAGIEVLMSGLVELNEIYDTDVVKKILKGISREQVMGLQSGVGAEATFFCPLAVRGAPIGYLQLASRAKADVITDSRRNLMKRLGDVVGIALDNAMMHAEIESTAANLRKANEHLRELDVAKDEFISMASHQLRTPLTTIKGYLSMLEDGDVGEISKDQLEYVDYAFTSSERMAHLISDLLDASRLAAGKFTIDYDSVDMVDMIEDELRQLHTHAEAKGLKVEFTPPAIAIPMVEVDNNKTRQVIMNFIDNAIYYTAEGKVHVRLERVKDRVRFTVKDTGIGVPEADQKKLFTKFFRAANAQSARPDGTGLGIFLAKRVIEDQDGTIVFESEVGKGSTFGFILPIKAKKVRHDG